MNYKEFANKLTKQDVDFVLSKLEKIRTVDKKYAISQRYTAYAKTMRNNEITQNGEITFEVNDTKFYYCYVIKECPNYTYHEKCVTLNNKKATMQELNYLYMYLKNYFERKN